MIKFARPLATLNLISINPQQILDNFSHFCRQFPSHHIWPVLKSNAYGHGLPQIVSILKDQTFDYYVVDSYYEALQIWQIHSHPVLLIGPNLPQNFKYFKFKNLALTIDNLTSLRALAALHQPINIHLKINTGMNRQGIRVGDLSLFLNFFKKYPQLHLEGLCSHLSCPQDKKFTQKQQKLFKNCLDQVHRSDLHPRFVHLSASNASARLPLGNAIRLGLDLYGYLPGLNPALTLTSTITSIQTLVPGDIVSYDGNFVAKSKTNIAVIPCGYYEGLDRRLSNSGFVKYQNKYFKIAGRVCMNLTCLNFKITRPKLFAPVEVISPHSTAKNSIQNIAKICQTIPYDILVHLSPSIRRVII